MGERLRCCDASGLIKVVVQQGERAVSPEVKKALLSIGLIVIVGAFVWIRNRKPRRLQVDRLWIIPATVVAAISAGLVLGRPSGAAFYWVESVLGAAGLAAGATAGWWRGSLMRLEVNKDDRSINAQVSPLGLVFMLGVLAVRRGIEYLVETGTLILPFNPLIVVQTLLLFVAATVVAQRVQLWARARRLLHSSSGQLPG